MSFGNVLHGLFDQLIEFDDGQHDGQNDQHDHAAHEHNQQGLENGGQLQRTSLNLLGQLFARLFKHVGQLTRLLSEPCEHGQEARQAPLL